jgi:hypothetical protein
MNALDLDRRYERTKQFLGMSSQLLRFFPCIHVWRLLPSVDRVQEPRRNLLFGRARPCIRETPLLVQVATLGADCHLTILPKAAAPMWRGTGGCESVSLLATHFTAKRIYLCQKRARSLLSRLEQAN